MDIEFVSIVEDKEPDTYTVAFDVIYAGETWCRSVVGVDAVVAARLEREQKELINTARDALLDLLATEAEPVSFQLRLTPEGTTVLARGIPGK